MNSWTRGKTPEVRRQGLNDFREARRIVQRVSSKRSEHERLWLLREVMHQWRARSRINMSYGSECTQYLHDLEGRDSWPVVQEILLLAVQTSPVKGSLTRRY